MAFRIWKRFEFSASHILRGLPEGHQCGRLHGHNYAAEIELAAVEVDATGFVVDYGDLQPVKEWIDRTLDHRHLNDTMDGNPTAENLARRLYVEVSRMLPAAQVVAVRVMETAKTAAEYRP